jgi:serine/threonine-protein kinase
MTEDAAPLTRHRRSVPPHVESAVLTALEKLPADRFATADAFAAALGGETASSIPIRSRSRRRCAESAA